MSAVAALLLSLMGTDRFGDPTPPGVMTRYGTNRLVVGKWNEGAIDFHPTRDEIHSFSNGAVLYPDVNESSFRAFVWKLPSGKELLRYPCATIVYSIDPSGRFRSAYPEERVVPAYTAAFSAAHRQKKPGTYMYEVGLVGDHLAFHSWPGIDEDSVAVIRVWRLTDAKPTPCEVQVERSAAVALSRHDGRLWSAEVKRGEIRSHSAESGATRSWRPFLSESDVDPGWRLLTSRDGRRLTTIQLRVNEKADRYRGQPECFVHVFNTAERRLEARYAFRFDDIGSDETPKAVEDERRGEYDEFTISDDGRFLAWSDPHGRLLIRHLATNRVVNPFGSGFRFRSLAFSPNGKRLAVLDHDNVIRIIDPYTGRFQHTADAPPTAAKQTAISPDGKLVATGHACGEVWVWDAVTGKPLWHTEPDGDPVRELHFNPTGTTVSAVGFWGPAGVRTFDARSGKELGPMLPYRYYRTLAVSADGKRIADLIEEKSVMEKGGWAYPLFIRTREIATGKEVGRVRLDHRLGLPSEVSAVISRDGRVVVVTHTNGDTIAYDTATGKRLGEMNSAKFRSAPGPMAVSEDGRIVARSWNATVPDTLVGTGHIAVFDTTTGEETQLDSKLDASVCTLSVSCDGRYVLAGSAIEVHPHIYDTRSRQLERRLTQHERAFFPNGKSVLTLPGIRGAERVSLEPLAWKVAPPGKPSEARLKQLWTQLSEPAALDAVFELARHSAEAVPFLKSKLLTEPPDAKAVAAHVAQLGSKAFPEREAATKSLRDFGPEVLPALRSALKAEPSPEAGRRLEKLIAAHADTAAPLTLARLRAVETLERCDTAESRDVLKTLAETRPGTPWADDAARTLARLRK